MSGVAQPEAKICFRDYPRLGVPPRFGDRGVVLTMAQWQRLWDLRWVPVTLMRVFDQKHAMKSLFQLEDDVYLVVTALMKKYPIEIRRYTPSNTSPAKILKTMEGQRLTKAEWDRVLYYGDVVHEMLLRIAEEREALQE